MKPYFCRDNPSDRSNIFPSESNFIIQYKRDRQIDRHRQKQRDDPTWICSSSRPRTFSKPSHYIIVPQTLSLSEPFSYLIFYLHFPYLVSANFALLCLNNAFDQILPPLTSSDRITLELLRLMGVITTNCNIFQILVQNNKGNGKTKHLKYANEFSVKTSGNVSKNKLR